MNYQELLTLKSSELFGKEIENLIFDSCPLCFWFWWWIFKDIRNSA